MGEWSCRKGDKACIVLIFFFAEGGRALQGEVCVFVGGGGRVKIFPRNKNGGSASSIQAICKFNQQDPRSIPPS